MLAAAGWLGVGCLEVEVATEVREDGSGRLVIRTDVDHVAVAQADPNLAGQDVDLEAMCTEMYDEDAWLSLVVVDRSWDLPPASYDLQVTAADEQCSAVETITWEAEHSDEVLRSEFDALSFGGPTIQRTDDGGWSFSLDLDLLEMDELEAERLRATVDEFELGMPVLRVSAALPGGPVEHNATSRRGGRFVWEYPFDSLPQEPPYAVTSPTVAESDGSPLSGGALVAVAAAVVVAVVLVVGFVVRRSRRALRHSV